MFNRSEILRRAWSAYRASFNYGPTKNLTHRERLARVMRNAWAEAKRKRAEAEAEARIIARLDAMPPERSAAFAALATLEAKERWTDDDRARATSLRDRIAA